MNGLSKSSDERIRIVHALTRLEACVSSLRVALRDDATPIGHDAVQALTQTAVEIATHSASADMALLFAKVHAE